MSAGDTQAGRYLVLGTAGHIDHGKTTLVKALTGIDCDRLAEEKARGITIELGFAHWQLPDGTHLGIIDMPGHKRFISNMVAGAVGIDMLLLVVAADDGVMPQTREHLQIARILGVQAGLVALTKTDTVDEELRELAITDVEDLLCGSFLDGCPIIPVSGVTRVGLEELTDTITELAAKIEPRAAQGWFRMPVDRVFTVKGVGTVVTGTTLAGSIAVDSDVEVVPGGKRARVRSVELHGESVSTIGAGHRAALNLVGVDKDDINRGDVLAAPGTLSVTYMLDAEVELLAEISRPMRRGSEALLHCGTRELTAKLFPLDGDMLYPGAPALVQLRLQQELPVAPGDRFILRDSTSEHTIGGGSVLDAHPSKHRRRRSDAAEQLGAMDQDSPLSAVIHETNKAQYCVATTTIALRLHVADADLRTLAAGDAAKKAGVMTYAIGNQVLLTTPTNRERIVAAVKKVLKAHREANPLKVQGLNAKALSKAIDRDGDGVPVDVLNAALKKPLLDGGIIGVEGTYALPQVEVQLSARDRKAINSLLDELNARAQADQPEEILELLPVDRKRMRQLLAYMLERRDIVTHSGMYFGSAAVNRVGQGVLAHFQQGATLSISELGKIAGTSRKYSVPLMNHFEQTGMLKRVGNDRVLNEDWGSGELGE